MSRISLVLLFLMSIRIYGQNYPPDNKSIVVDYTNLPIVFIDTYGQEIKKNERISAKMKIVNNSNNINYGDTIQYPNQNVDIDCWVGIKYRGNTSYTMSPKKPYSIKLLKTPIEEGGEKLDASILGMGKDNDWCLLAPYNDRSLIRDVLTFELARGYLEYVPKARFCEVYLDGIYYGVYIICERVRRGKERLNIKKPGDAGDELTGGYLLEVDRNDERVVYESQFPPRNSDGYEFVNDKIYIQYKNPDCDEITDSQKEFIDNRIYEFESALDSDNFSDPNNGYRRYVDVTSFIDYQLITEISNNIDGYRQSTYLYKYRDSIDPRFKMSIWDFNIAWGVAEFPNIHTGYRYDVWAYKNNDEGLEHKMPFWFGRLMQDESYVSALKQRYYQYRKEKCHNLNEIVDSLVNVLSAMGAVDRNYEAWPRWGSTIWPNYFNSTSYTEEINYLKDWITNRIEWLDDQLGYDLSTGFLSVDQKGLDDMIIYSIYGMKQTSFRKGLNIYRTKNGIVKKIFINH